MCLLAEIGMFIMGIVAIVRGRVAMSRTKTVTGTPAYVIGTLLVITLPVVAGIGVLMGLLAVAQGVPPEQVQNKVMRDAAGVDAAVVLAVLAICFVLSTIYGRDPRDVESEYHSTGDHHEVDDVEEVVDWIDDSRTPR